MDDIPVTLLTGFLGSGKSTLLTQILNDARFDNTAVVVNEFGEVGLDGFLIEHTDDQIIEMTSGCLCCTIRGDIRETLLSLYRRRNNGDVPAFSRLIVETTGLADPAPVIHTLISEPRLVNRYMFSGIVTTIDAITGDATMDIHSECVKQVAVADRLVITKTDLLNDPYSRNDLEKLKAKLRTLNPSASILERHDSVFNLDNLFDTALYNPNSYSMDVLKWLNAEIETNDGDHNHDAHHHGHRHHSNQTHHDVSRHGTNIRSYTLVFQEPLSIEAFGGALEALTTIQGANLLRLKGIVNIADRPGRPLVIHGVQHVFHDPVWLEAWPSPDERTRLVIITHGIERKTLEDFFKGWIGLEPI